MTEPLEKPEQEEQENGTTAFAARKDILAALANASQRATASSSSGIKFHKLELTSQNLRVAQDPTDVHNPYIIGLRQHKGLNEEGKFRTALDLRWLVDNGKRYPGLDAKLTVEDREKIELYGDPAAFIAAKVRELAPGGKLDNLPDELRNAKNKPFSEFKAVVTVVKDATPGLLEVNKASYDTLIQIAGTNPEALTVDQGCDLCFSTNGKSGMAKRYNPPIIVMSSQGTAIEYQGNFPKSVAVLQSRVLGYAEKRDFAIRNYGAFMKFAGLSPEDIGS